MLKWNFTKEEKPSSKSHDWTKIEKLAKQNAVMKNDLKAAFGGAVLGSAYAILAPRLGFSDIEPSLLYVFGAAGGGAGAAFTCKKVSGLIFGSNDRPRPSQP